MKEQKHLHINKLSTVMPETSHATAGKKLYVLRQLLIKSEKVTDEISQIIAKLRHVKVAAVFTAVAANKTCLKEALKHSGDITFNEFTTFSSVKVLIVYIDAFL